MLYSIYITTYARGDSMKTLKSLLTRTRFLTITSAFLILVLLIVTIWHGYPPYVISIEALLFILCFTLIFFYVKVDEKILSCFLYFQKNKQNGYLDLFFEYSQDAIAVFTPSNEIIAVNPAFTQLYLYSEDECIGKSIHFYDPSAREQVIERQKLLMEGKHFNNIRTKELRKDGTSFFADTTLTPIFNKNKEVIAISVIIRNITDRIEAERDKFDSIKINAFGELAASVAHEVRNPLTSVSGFIQMMNMDIENPYRPYTEIMESEIDRINLIVNEFLILSKPHLKTHTELNLEDILFDVVELFGEELKEHKITCEVYLAEYVSTISGNAISLKQLFINLMKNALDAGERNGFISFTVSLVNNRVSVTIRDSGTGVSPAIANQIFNPFFSTKKEASGLGLVITKKIVLDHLGQIELNHRVIDATEFIVTFPTTSINGIPTIAAPMEIA